MLLDLTQLCSGLLLLTAQESLPVALLISYVMLEIEPGLTNALTPELPLKL